MSEGGDDPGAFGDLPNPDPTDEDAIDQKDAFLNILWTNSHKISKNYKKAIKQKILLMLSPWITATSSTRPRCLKRPRR